MKTISIFNIFKEKKEVRPESKLLHLLNKRQNKFRTHCSYMSQYDESYYLDEEYLESKIEKFNRVFFPETPPFIFHGACLSCKAPKNYGITICVKCAIIDRDNKEAIDYSHQN
jgi:hypothetical protein